MLYIDALHLCCLIHVDFFHLFSFSQSLYLLESMLTLLTCPSTASNQAILSRICDFLLTLLQSQRGILYLSANGDTTTALIKMLVNLPFETPDDSVFNPQQIGLQMAFNLHVRWAENEFIFAYHV